MSRTLVADDLTGASDAGVQFAKRGLRTTVWLDYAAVADLPRTEATDVVVIDTDSRAIAPQEAYARMVRLLEGIAPRSPCDIVKKIDSTLRGNPGAEIRALLERLPDAFALVCPAYPRNARTSSGGRLSVGGTPVDRTDFGRDLFSPVKDARIASHLEGPSVLCDVSVVRAGAAELGRKIDAARERGIRMAVVDAECDEDLAAIAALDDLRDDILWAGSAGLIEMLEGGVRGAATAEMPRDGGPVVFLVGSLSSMTQRQIDDFAAAGRAIERLDPVDVLRGAPSVAATVARAAAELDRGRDVLVALDGRRDRVEAALQLGLQQRWDATTTSGHLREAFVAATRPLVGGRRSAIVLSGGDIARAFCTAHDIRGMTLLAEAAPGIPIARAIGAEYHLITKAGGFGTPSTYRDIVATLRAEITV